MFGRIVLSLLILAINCNVKGQVPINISLDLGYTQQMNISLTDGVYQINTLGGDPFVKCTQITQTYYPDTTYVIEFEYFSLTGLDDLRIYFDPFSSANSASQGALPVAEGWTSYMVNLKRYSDTWAIQNHDYLRFDFGKSAGKSISVRNIKLRTITAKEYNDWKNSPDKVLTQKLIAYNTKVFDKKIENVKVDADSITISGSGSSNFSTNFLSEILMYENAFDKEQFDFSVALPALNSFQVKVPRFAKNDKGETYDRLYSRWMVTDNAGTTLSHAHWADDISTIAQWDIPEVRPTTAKGMGGVGSDSEAHWEELVELGVHNITFNFILPSLIKLDVSSVTHELNGKTYYINETVVNKLDKMFKFCSENDIQVSVILLIGSGTGGELGQIFKHPDANGGTYTLANVVQERGIEYYVAAIDFLSQRYSRPDNEYGRITNWILHNEVDAAPVWTNAGDKPQDLYIEQYSRSMRAVYYTARKYNPVSKVFISLTHYWKVEHTYSVPGLLAYLTEQGKREGDFEWGVAYHPYPENLRDPDPWDDNVSTDISNADYITPKNLELIDQWARTHENLYQDCKVRSVILSENGISQHDYSREQLDMQAAGVAYYWKKLTRLPSIEAFHYHRWVDHDMEGNLKFGLWSNKEGTVNDFGKKKPSWTLYRYAGTNFEDTAFDFTKTIIGISNWNDIYNSVSPEIQPYSIQFEILNNGVPLLGSSLFFNKELRKSDVSGQCKFLNIASSVNQSELTIHSAEGGVFKFPITVNESKTVTIDIGLASKSEIPLSTANFIDVQSVYQPFNYSEWFPTGLNNIIPEMKTKLYPNPASEKVTVVLGQNISGIRKAEIVDMTGKIFHPEYKINNNQLTFEIGNLPKGFYLISIVLEKSTVKQRFCKF